MNLHVIIQTEHGLGQIEGVERQHHFVTRVYFDVPGAFHVTFIRQGIVVAGQASASI